MCPKLLDRIDALYRLSVRFTCINIGQLSGALFRNSVAGHHTANTGSDSEVAEGFENATTGGVRQRDAG